MGVPTSEVSYTLATTGRGDHKVHKGQVVALAKKILLCGYTLLAVTVKMFGNFPESLFMKAFSALSAHS
jgi:hypothetical protein